VQAPGSLRARVTLILRPRLGSLRSFMRMQRHLLLSSLTCLRAEQQSMVETC